MFRPPRGKPAALRNTRTHPASLVTRGKVPSVYATTAYTEGVVQINPFSTAGRIKTLPAPESWRNRVVLCPSSCTICLRHWPGRSFFKTRGIIHFTTPPARKEGSTPGLQQGTGQSTGNTCYRSAGELLCYQLQGNKNLGDKNNFVNCVFRDVVHRPFQRVLYFPNYVLLHGTHRDAILFTQIRKIPPSLRLFSRNSQTFNSIT